jgi:4-amino-4-deoxy-L-arabinose transferase-like glycosyltransferase
MPGPAPGIAAVPDAAERVTRAGVLLVLYCAVLFFWNLGAAPLTDVDEGAFSEATREMLARGDYVTTYLNGALRFDKPILTYWLQALPVALAGPQAWAFRLPSALAGCLWVCLMWRFARRYAPAATLMAPFMLASALGPLVIARSATADALLNAFLAGALFALYRHLAEGGRGTLVAAFAWMGLGLLAKGPIALFVPALAVGFYCWTRREWLRPLRLLADPLAWVALLAIALPWYVLELRDQGDAFIAGFFLKHNVHRFSATMLGHGGHAWYYVLALPVLVFPFVAPLAAALASGLAALRSGGAVAPRVGVRDDVQRFAWCTFLPVFVFFSLSRTQLPHYLLYGMTPLFLLLALHRSRFGAWSVALPPALGLLLAAALPWLARHAAPHTGNGLAQLLLSDFGATMTTLVLPSLVALAALAFALAAVARLPAAQRRDGWLYAAGGVPALFLVTVLWPQGVTWFQAPVRAAGEYARTLPDVVEWNANWPSFSVYRQAVTPSRRPLPGEVVLTRIDRADELPPHDVLFAQREVLLARVR